MKKYLFLILGLCSLKLLLAQTSFQWAKRIGGTSVDNGNSIAVDASGNVYTTGCFADTVDFDPGPGTYTLTTDGSFDAFISKIDAAGNFVWAKKTGGPGTQMGQAITLDAFGNVYTTGYFLDTVDFDPGPATFTLGCGLYDAFVLKLDAAGNFVWAKQFGGTSDDRGYSIALDASGNVYTTGFFQGTADFDPGPGTFTLGAPSSNLDAFISKLDAAGNFLWAKQLSGTGTEFGTSIDIDPSGNVYSTGYFNGTTDFDPGPGTFNLSAPSSNLDVFISKLDAAGNFLWAKRIGDIWDDRGKVITTDASGNVFATGRFSGTVDFDPGSGTFTLTASANFNDFILKLNGAGNFVWAKQLSPTIAGLTLDAAGNIYTAGYFTSQHDFDPGPGTFYINSAGLS
nr:SBBP repeat-containing protein [Bacteroidota bacterium]